MQLKHIVFKPDLKLEKMLVGQYANLLKVFTLSVGFDHPTAVI